MTASVRTYTFVGDGAEKELNLSVAPKYIEVYDETDDVIYKKVDMWDGNRIFNATAPAFVADDGFAINNLVLEITAAFNLDGHTFTYVVFA